jgi:hypothetical protein
VTGRPDPQAILLQKDMCVRQTPVETQGQWLTPREYREPVHKPVCGCPINGEDDAPHFVDPDQDFSLQGQRSVVGDTSAEDKQS